MTPAHITFFGAKWFWNFYFAVPGLHAITLLPMGPFNERSHYESQPLHMELVVEAVQAKKKNRLTMFQNGTRTMITIWQRISSRQLFGHQLAQEEQRQTKLKVSSNMLLQRRSTFGNGLPFPTTGFHRELTGYLADTLTLLPESLVNPTSDKILSLQATQNVG